MKKIYLIIALVFTVGLGLGFSDNVSGEHTSVIPSWIKNNAGWWADDSISDSEFLSGIKYLIDNNIISIKSDTAIPSVVIITEKTKYHTGEEILITVKNIGTEPITFPGAPLFVIKNVQNQVICCSGPDALLTLFPNKQYNFTWHQIDSSSSSNRAETGKYEIFLTFKSKNYLDNIYEVTRWIEISD